MSERSSPLNSGEPIDFRPTKIALSDTHEDDKGEGKGSIRSSYAPTSQKSTTVDSMIVGGPNSHMMTKSHHGSHDDVMLFDTDMFDKSDALTSNDASTGSNYYPPILIFFTLLILLRCHNPSLYQLQTHNLNTNLT